MGTSSLPASLPLSPWELHSSHSVLTLQGPGPVGWCCPVSSGCRAPSRCSRQSLARLERLQSRESGRCRGASRDVGSCIWSGVEAQGRMALVEEESCSGCPVTWPHVSLCSIPCRALYMFNFPYEPHFIDEETKAQDRHVTCPKAALGARILACCPQSPWQGTSSRAGLLQSQRARMESQMRTATLGEVSAHSRCSINIC